MGRNSEEPTQPDGTGTKWHQHDETSRRSVIRSTINIFITFESFF